MGVIGELLFAGVRNSQRPTLSDLLSHYQLQKTEELAMGLSNAKFSQLTEDEIVTELVGWLAIEPICINRDAATSDVRQIQVEADNPFGGNIKVQGFKITKTFPFSGDARLFDLRPRTYGLNGPYGLVDGQKLIIGMDVRQEHQAAAVAHIKSTIKLVENCIAGQLPELEEHRAKLPHLLLPLVQNRRRLLSLEDDLKSQLDAI